MNHLFYIKQVKLFVHCHGPSAQATPPKQGGKPMTIATALRSAVKKTKSIMFPNIHTILRIMLTFPVTTCTCERSISVLNRVKSFNRTTQLDDRLTGLCIIFRYRNVEINWDKIINTFANKNPRRMALINILDDEKLSN